MDGPAVKLVCPETLTPLEPRESGWWSPGAERLYPVRESLLFLGYATRDEAWIDETMQEEREWQGTAETVERDIWFLRRSAPAAVAFINHIARHMPAERRPLTVEIGSGSCWVSWLLTQAGCDTWACDFEANSLAIGQMYDLGEGPRRLVADARYIPFADGALDLVVAKEFVHHVVDFTALFREANRVLRPGGLLAIFEPIKSLKNRISELRYPDPHKGHHIVGLNAYLRAIERSGFTVEREAFHYDEHRHRNPVLRVAKEQAARRARGLAEPGRYVDLHARLFGGASSILLARKTAQAPAVARPPMTIIDPDTLVIAESERAPFARMLPILADAAESLDTRWREDPVGSPLR